MLSSLMARLASFLILLASALAARAAEVIPPPPEKYFNDLAGAVRLETAAQLNEKLAAFDRETSSQIVVSIFPKMETDSSLEDYTQRIFEAWKPGRAKLDNGALLLVFVQDRKLRIHTGYGLEGALPDAICKRIIEDEITPRFKARDFDGGMTAGVAAMIAAAKGEYRGTGRTVLEEKSRGRSSGSPGGLLIVFFIIATSAILAARMGQANRGTIYSSRGRRNRGIWIWPAGPPSGGSWGGGSGGGGGGFSGFSGGGGSSGGGGASGSW
jgi:uncharacterized protein